jgi:hypothetical protein
VKQVAGTVNIPSVEPRGHNAAHTYLRLPYFLVQLHWEDKTKKQYITAGRKKVIILQIYF